MSRVAPDAAAEKPFEKFPHYAYPPQLIWGLARDALLCRHRNFRRDAQACIGRLDPPLCVLGRPQFPAAGIRVITLNHYYRPGFQAQWSAFAISASVPADVHWTMTGELTFPGSWIAPLGKPISRFVLRRSAAVYDFTSMPPMPPRPGDVAARALAVRRVLRYVKHDPNAVIGLAPEGGDQPGGRLSMPPAGLGRFSLLLAEAGACFIPVGVVEQDGRFTLNFGAPYQLDRAPSSAADEKDRLVSFQIMSHIAALLPQELRGEFQSTAEAWI